MTESKAKPPISRSIRYYIMAGFMAVLLLAGGLGGWAALAEISGAVVASGIVVVESSVKKVQHRTGGIVGEIRVTNGDRVEAGDLLIRLDETLVRANLEIIAGQLVEFEARLARLEAERDKSDQIGFPKQLLDGLDDPDIAKAIAGERTLFEARRTTISGQIAQHKERIAQLNQQISGLEAQREAKLSEIDLIQKELVGLEILHAKGHVPITRINALKRDAARLTGEERAFVSQVAVTRGQITEIGLTVLQVERDFREAVLKELQEVQAKVAELRERRVAAEDELVRSKIVAPVAGFVHEMAVHTVGGVIQPGEQVLLIVPEQDALLVEARVAPTDIDQLRPGQAAMINFSAFNQRTTPQLHGTLKRISPDLSRDEATGTYFYTARVIVDDGEMKRLTDLELLPGMPAEVFITTSDRSVISYLVKPLADQLQRTFREQ